MEPNILEKSSLVCYSRNCNSNSCRDGCNRINTWKWSVSKLCIGLFLFLCCAIENSYAGKLLIVHPMYTGSHVLTLRTVAESLTKRGHQVHIVRWRDEHYFPTVNNPNITETLLSVDNSDGKWTFLTKEKNAAFKVKPSKNGRKTKKNVVLIYVCFVTGTVRHSMELGTQLFISV